MTENLENGQVQVRSYNNIFRISSDTLLEFGLDYLTQPPKLAQEVRIAKAF